MAFPCDEDKAERVKDENGYENPTNGMGINGKNYFHSHQNGLRLRHNN